MTHQTYRRCSWHMLWPLALLVGTAPFVRADARIANRLTVAGQTLDSTIYVQGAKARTEVRFPDSVMVRIDECGNSRVLHINDGNKAYYYERTGNGLADSRPGSLLRVVSNTRDTGERKQILGREARHLHTELRTQASSGACGENIHVIADGWYADLDFLPRCLTPDLETIFRDRVRALGCNPDPHFQSSGEALRGYAVLLDMTLEEAPSVTNMATPGSPSSIHQETTEIASSPLSVDLFRAPEGYREVDSMEDLLNSAEPKPKTGERESTAASLASGPPERAPGLSRIGVAYPDLPTSLRGTDIQRQIIAALKAKGRDGVALESQTKEDAVRECRSRDCSYVMLTTFAVDRSAPAEVQNGSKTRIHFTVLPIGNPNRALEGDNFFDSTYAQSGTAAAIQDAVKTVLAQIEKLGQ